MTDAKKTFILFDKEFRVSGSASDLYFASLPDGGDITDPVLKGIRPYVGEGGTYIDVGANIGLYTLALSAIAPAGRIYALEPAAGSFKHLSDNLAANGLGNVKAFQVALGDQPGTLHFHDVPFFTAGSFVVNPDSFLTGEVIGSNLIETPCTTLDAFVAEQDLPALDLLKIDVEGAEMRVLRGARASLERFRPKVLVEFSSFSFTLHQELLPQQALAELRSIFPHLFVMSRTDGSLARLTTDTETYDFLYDNGIHGPVDNLLCTFEDLPVDRGYKRLDPNSL